MGESATSEETAVNVDDPVTHCNHSKLSAGTVESPHTSTHHIIYEEKNWMQRHRLYSKMGRCSLNALIFRSTVNDISTQNVL